MYNGVPNPQGVPIGTYNPQGNSVPQAFSNQPTGYQMAPNQYPQPQVGGRQDLGLRAS